MKNTNFWVYCTPNFLYRKCVTNQYYISSVQVWKGNFSGTNPDAVRMNTALQFASPDNCHADLGVRQKSLTDCKVRILSRNAAVCNVADHAWIPSTIPKSKKKIGFRNRIFINKLVSQSSCMGWVACPVAFGHYRCPNSFQSTSSKQDLLL